MEKVMEFLVSHLSDLFSAATTLFAAFIGAWFAFRFQNTHEKRKSISDNASAINIIHIQLFQHYNNLLQLGKELRSRFPDDPIYWINIPALSTRDRFPDINISGLGFFVQAGNPTLVAKLLLAQEKYNEIVKALNLRSEMHLTGLQPIIERFAASHGEIADATELMTQIGERLSGGIRNLTDGILGSLPGATRYFEDLSVEIYEESRKHIPKQKFFRFANGDQFHIEKKSVDEKN